MNQTIISLSWAVMFAVCGWLGVRLSFSFWRNGFRHKPLRWLIGWLGGWFCMVAIIAGQRVYARVQLWHTGVPLTLDSWWYVVPLALAAFAACGVLWVWLRFPVEDERP